MRQVAFSIPFTGIIYIDGDSLRIKVNETTITMKLEPDEEAPRKLMLEAGRTLFDVVLDAARSFVQETGTNEFTGAELYHIALRKHPELNLKRNSWGAHVISCAPNHPSYRHSTARRSYFRYLGNGRYSLDQSLVSADTTQKEDGMHEY